MYEYYESLQEYDWGWDGICLDSVITSECLVEEMNTDFQSNGIGRILKYEGVDAQGYGVYSTPASINRDTKTWIKNHAIGQCWYASVGIKYIFN